MNLHKDYRYFTAMLIKDFKTHVEWNSVLLAYWICHLCFLHLCLRMIFSYLGRLHVIFLAVQL